MRTAVDSLNFVQNWTSDGLYRNQKYEVCEVQCIFVSEILLLKIFGKSVCKSMFAINFLTRGIILTIDSYPFYVIHKFKKIVYRLIH